MPAKPIGDKAMTEAERQARYRAAHAAGEPAVRYRRPAGRRGRAARWDAAVAELAALQAEYQEWLDALPDGLQETATAERQKVLALVQRREIDAVLVTEL